MFRQNLLINTDSYKASHYLQYPPNTEYVNSYIESRGGRWNRTLFFGLQMFIREYLSIPITMNDINQAADFWKMHGLPFNREGFEYILKKHDGYLPIQIDAVDEGSIVETKNVLVQIINTDPNCFWLTSFLETALLRAVWYPCAVATNSFMCKEIIREYLEKTADNPDAEIMFKLHDFGFRGVSSYESAAIGGCAHLVNFMGSDTTAGILAAKYFYDHDMAGFSIPASEHSTITSWGEEHEIDAFENMIRQFSGINKIYACVSDSYDLFEAIETKWTQLKDKIIESGGTLVVRPDSGNPIEIVSESIERLMSNFGFSYNTKGFKVLPNYIRVIQGDGIDEQSIADILKEMTFRKLSTSNIAFGMGGALLQHLNRDTQKFAMKCSSITQNGKEIDVFKKPKTDLTKQSKPGRLALIKVNPKDNIPYYKTIRESELNGEINQLKTVFKNGKILRNHTFEEIRKRTNGESNG